LAVKANWPDEVDRAIKRSKLYLNLLVDAALKHEKEKSTEVPLVFSDMLAMSGNQHYMEHFNITKAILKDAQHAPSPLT
jgi:hypothetical protein